MAAPLGQTALITGASSGIGYELTKRFAQEGYDLVMVARSEEPLRRCAAALQAASGVSTTVIAMDLARPSAPGELARQLEAAGRSIDVLINNAGFGAHGPFAETDLAVELEMVQVNVVAVMELTKRLLPGMLERRRGMILNVASTAAFQPGPLMAVYYATKAYLLSFSEALANELRGTGVSVTALCPGPTRTSFQQRSGMEHSRLMSGALMEAEAVARCGYEGLMRRKVVVIPGWKNRLLAFGVRLLPRSVVTRAVRRLQESRPRASAI